MAARTAYRLTSALFTLISIGVALLSAAFLPGDPGWAIAGSAAVVVCLAVTAMLWREVPGSGPMAFGVGALGVGLWTQSLLALGFFAAEPNTVSMTTAGVCLVVSAATCGASLLIPRTMSWRQTISLALASAAAVPAVVFALVPDQLPAVTAAMGGGAVIMLASTVALAKGKTWGLLANFVGAATIAVGVFYAPWLGKLTATHAMLPNCGGFFIDILGMASASLAALSSALFLGPIVRFLLGARSAEPKPHT